MVVLEHFPLPLAGSLAPGQYTKMFFQTAVSYKIFAAHVHCMRKSTFSFGVARVLRLDLVDLGTNILLFSSYTCSRSI